MQQTCFLDSEFPQTPSEEARFHIIPVPLERTVSYKGGTAKGPEAIIEASGQLERLVEGMGEPGALGIHTHPAMDCSSQRSPKAIFSDTAMLIERIRNQGGIPILLGGEHSVTNGAIRHIVDAGIAGTVGILQFDAHMDLRDTYEGTSDSHASVMRRAVESGIRLHQVGIRNFSQEELEAREAFGVSYNDASDIYRRKGRREGFSEIALPADFPNLLYITFDVDGFDASLMSATGTPDPGGLFWWEAIDLLQRLTEGRTIMGADVVELAPVGQLHHCDYTAAKLTYFLMGLIARRNRYPHDHIFS